MATESLGAELKKQRNELSAYYRSLYNEDEAFIKTQAEKYAEDKSDDEEVRKLVQSAFIAGWKFSIYQPLVKSIHMIAMYAYDYVPNRVNLKNAVTKIRQLFREHIAVVDIEYEADKKKTK